ncbi:MAG: ABC transporter substrate-binding protein [Bacillota bacterium]|nr:ABC transporter substrate-binding protein [Bacillota bacterium]
MIKLETGITSKTSQNWTTFIAQDKGYFLEEGIDHTYKVLSSMAEGIDALAKCEICIATGASDAPVVGIDRGLDLCIIGSVNNVAYGHIVSGKQYIKFSDLAFTEVAGIDVNAGSTLVLKEILRMGGVEEEKYSVKPVGGTPFRYEAIVSGEVSAAYLSPPFDFQAEEDGYNILADCAKYFPSYSLTINANKSFVQKNEETVKKFLKAMVKASHWLYDSSNKEEAIEILASNTNMEKKYAYKTYDYVIEEAKGVSFGCELNIDGFKKLLQLMLREKMIKDTNEEKYILLDYLPKAKKGE